MAVQSPHAFPSPTISWGAMEAATGDSDGKIADSDSGELLIVVVHLSVRRVKNCDDRLLFGLYHETFHIREDGETFFSHRGLRGHLIDLQGSRTSEKMPRMA